MKFWLTLLLALAALPALSQPARIVVIRHAEKPSDPEDNHLSREGKARAKALVKFFTANTNVISLGSPAAFYANRPTRRGRGLRSMETLEPAAKHYRLPVQTPFESEDFERMAYHVLHNTQLSGKTVVICWTHEYLPALAGALGVDPMPRKWKDPIYDQAYVINFPKGKKPELDIINQELMPGDRK